ERSRGEKHAGLRLNPEVAALRSEFIGYPNETGADGLRVLAVVPGEPGVVVLDRTPFYAEGGGQIGDRARSSARVVGCGSTTPSAPVTPSRTRARSPVS
ncbi:MAG: hypothetical protein ABR593_11795, partial [Candidatus Limnocylindria bacterium]